MALSSWRAASAGPFQPRRPDAVDVAVGTRHGDRRPLVNLNGQVIGITVTGSGTGLKIGGYAMPVNQALTIARQIDNQARRPS